MVALHVRLSFGRASSGVALSGRRSRRYVGERARQRSRWLRLRHAAAVVATSRCGGVGREQTESAQEAERRRRRHSKVTGHAIAALAAQQAGRGYETVCVPGYESESVSVLSCLLMFFEADAAAAFDNIA